MLWEHLTYDDEWTDLISEAWNGNRFPEKVEV